MGRKKKFTEDALSEDNASAHSHSQSGEIDPEDFPHLSPEEILAQTQAIEAAKAEKKRQREHRKRLKELQAAQEKKSRLVAPIILIISIIICLILTLIFPRN